MQLKEIQIKKNMLISEFFSHVGKFSLPFCDVCEDNRRQQRVEKLYAEATISAFEKYVSVFVECHGDKQMVIRAHEKDFPHIKAKFKDGWRAFQSQGWCRENGVLVPGEKPIFINGVLVPGESDISKRDNSKIWKRSAI